MASIIRIKRVGGKILAGVWLITLACGGLNPCSGMEAMTQSELNEMIGYSGITMRSDGTVVFARQQFQSICQGDKDGWGNSQDDNIGWLVMIGNGVNTGALTFTVPNATEVTIDVGTTTGACTPAGATCPGFVIPSGTSYFTFSMTDADIGLQTPTTVSVALASTPLNDGSTATAISSEMELIGWIMPVNLMIDKANMTSHCYIWAHP